MPPNEDDEDSKGRIITLSMMTMKMMSALKARFVVFAAATVNAVAATGSDAGTTKLQRQRHILLHSQCRLHVFAAQVKVTNCVSTTLRDCSAISLISS